MTKSTPRDPRTVLISVSVIALIVAAYFLGLNLPFLGPDEPRYAQVAREMMARGDWITPTLGGYTWFEKPALLYWFEIVAYSVFGVNEFAARLGSALSGLGVVASLWLLARYATADDEPGISGQMVALIASSTLSIVGFSHGASFDIVVTLPITAALVSYYLFNRRIGPPTLLLAAFYFFIGMAVLAKGLVGVVIPFGVIGLYHLLSRRGLGRTFLFSMLWGVPLTGAIAAIWYLPMYLTHGWPFIDEFIIQHHFQRFTSDKYRHWKPFYYYFWVLPLMTLPWLPFVLAGLWTSIKRQIGEPSGATPNSSTPLLLYSLSWLAFPVIFFTFSGSKLAGYVLPAVPAAAVLAAVALRSRRGLVVGLACTTLLVVIVLGFTVAPRYADTDSVRGLIEDAAARGYSAERVFGFQTVSHSAEFYAAGRLLRDAEGDQKKIHTAAELRAEMSRAGITRALALVPLQHLNELDSGGELRSEVIRDNGRLAIVVVTLPPV
jgi:4-amino-4-deoxy-L-arabinose transferase-like glycosyltransferase